MNCTFVDVVHDELVFQRALWLKQFHFDIFLIVGMTLLVVMVFMIYWFVIISWRNKK